MTQIMLLDSETIDRIAAGEVVERPYSVVKELTENAIDAGADAVTVEIRDGGRTLIRVTDNGYGIASDMVRSAFLRHSTSKLRRIEDLETIRTLGFRGEALSSIAAVADVEMMTKTADEIMGTSYRISYGNETGMEQIGLPQGTTILVRDLFAHMPARQKFLKTDQTETAYVTQLLEELALSHPQVSLRCIADGRTKLQTAGTGNLRDVIYRICGSRTAKNLIEINAADGPYHLYGYIGQPSLARGNRRYETIFVNGRYIRNDRVLQKGIEDGYKRYLMQHQFPFTVLCFETSGSLVDVNVHPAKAQVRFSDEKAVYGFVCGQVSLALHQAAAIEELPLAHTADPTVIHSPDNVIAPPQEDLVRETAEPYEASLVHQERTSPAVPQKDAPEEKAALPRMLREEFSAPVQPQTAVSSPAYEQLAMPIPQTRRARFRLIGQTFDTYWILEFDGKLYLIDQHAAHERVNYERLLQLFRAGTPASQQVFPAIPVTLQAQEITLLEQYLPVIRSCGFTIEPFGGNEYRICEVPTELFGMNAEVFFLSLLDELNDLSSGTIDPDTVTDRLAAAACKASIKGHDVISDAEVLVLLEKLFACDDPYHCPHGRPTLVSVTKAEIEKMFRRIVS